MNQITQIILCFTFLILVLCNLYFSKFKSPGVNFINLNFAEWKQITRPLAQFDTQNKKLYLTEGNWKYPLLKSTRTNFPFKEILQDKNLQIQDVWQSKFLLKTFNSTDLQNCLAQKSLKIIGDSRSRQNFLTIQSLLQNSGIIDQAQHYDLSFEFQIKNHRNVSISWYWQPKLSDKLHPNSEIYRKLKLILREKPTKVTFIIINSFLLHETSKCLNSTDCVAVFNKFIDDYHSIEYDLINFLTASNQNKLIWMSTINNYGKYEHLQDPSWIPTSPISHQHLQNQILQKSNQFISKRFQDLLSRFPDFINRLAFMTTNNQTAYYQNTSILPDGTHKLARFKLQRLPISLFIDTQVMFNYLCS